MKSEVISFKRFIIFLFCLLYFLFIPAAYTKCAYGLLFVPPLLLKRNFKNGIKDILTAVICYIFLVIYIISPYDQFMVSMTWLCLLYAMLFMQDFDTEVPTWVDKSLERILWIFTVIFAAMVLTFGPKAAAGAGDGDSLFFAAYSDRNYTALIVFLIFLYGEKRRLPGGKMLLLYFTLFCTHSRSIVLMILVYIVCCLVKKILPERIFLKFQQHNYMFWILAVLTVLLMLFSFFWVFSINQYSDLRIIELLNDDSNRMRFSSNIYSWEYLLKRKEIIFSGYGADVKKIMGIPNDEWVIYNGVRLVKSHNSVISIILTMGWIPGVLFLYLLGFFLSKHMTKDNFEYILPILINSLILPVFEQAFIIFWLLLVSISKRERGPSRIRVKAFRIKMKNMLPFRSTRKLRLRKIYETNNI